MEINKYFWKDKIVFVSGHTGFKGAWLCTMLYLLGAKVVGYSLAPAGSPNLFDICNIANTCESILEDIRDKEHVLKAFARYEPQIVIHLAAQSLVSEGYHNPAYTYDVNVMGTVNILDAIAKTRGVRSVVNVTTDKVYFNNESIWGYRENDVMDGYDPYSNSKSCSELVTASYKRSFLSDVAISTCRAGNVIGGGDFSINRIIPDCVRAVANKKTIEVRNPQSVRPYQHVIEPLYAYLLIAQKQWENMQLYEGAYNIGPDMNDCLRTEQLANIFCELWGNDAAWIEKGKINAIHEANTLKLDCTKIKETFSWMPKWTSRQAVEYAVAWYKLYYSNGDVSKLTQQQIEQYWSK